MIDEFYAAYLPDIELIPIKGYGSRIIGDLVTATEKEPGVVDDLASLFILRSCFKTPQLALYGVINRFKMLIYARVNCAFSPIYALSRTHLRGFKTASNLCQNRQVYSCTNPAE